MNERESIRLGWRHGLWYLPKNALVFPVPLPEGVKASSAVSTYELFLTALESKGHDKLASLLRERLILEAR